MNQVKFTVEMKIDSKDYGASVICLADDDNKISLKYIFETASQLGLMSAIKAQKLKINKKNQSVAKLENFEIPRIFKCANSPLYELDERTESDGT